MLIPIYESEAFDKEFLGSMSDRLLDPEFSRLDWAELYQEELTGIFH